MYIAFQCHSRIPLFVLYYCCFPPKYWNILKIFWGRCFIISSSLTPPSFPIGLVKTESYFIVRSVETSLGRWMLVVAVICVDAYPFLAYPVTFSVMSRMEVCSYSYYWWYGYFRGPWVSFITTNVFLMRATKITSRTGVLWTHSLPFCFWPIFNSMNYGHIIKRIYNRKLNHTAL